MPSLLLQLRDIALTFGGTPLLAGVDLSVAEGDRLCLVGRNGSGKSTLLKIAAGLIEPDRGERSVQPNAVIRYLPQEPDFSRHATVRAYVEAGLGPSDEVHEANYLLEQLGLTGDETPATLSGGEARRAAIARVLAPDPDLLLLDEPTNHLDLPMIEWLETRLAGQRGAIVTISHDRRFLETLSRGTVWLDRGRSRQLEFGFSKFEAWRDEKLAEEELEQHKLDRKIATEEDWLRYGVTARRKRNVKRLANLHSLRQSRRDYRGAAGNAVIEAAQAEKSGAQVIEAKNISKSYGGTPIVRDFSTRVMRGDRLGIVGPNGSGKTTLVNLLTGALAPDAGEIRLGANIEMAALDQRRDSLDPNWSLREALTGGTGDSVSVGNEQRHVIGYMKDFLFSPEQARTPLRSLSGGERGRVMLARALARPSNLLVLDEPTNDLDLETLDVVEEMLSNYAGTVILISHDRDFIDRVVNGVIVPDGNGRWLEYAGGYSDMLAQRGADIYGRERNKTVVRKTEKTATVVAAQKQPKRKLSFNEKYALENLPGKIAGLQATLAELQSKFDDPELYQRDPKAFETISRELAETQAELTGAEEKWLELEMLREEIESK